MKKFYSQIIVNNKTDRVRISSKKKNLEPIKKVKIQPTDMATTSNATYVDRLITLHQNALIKVIFMARIISRYLSQI